MLRILFGSFVHRAAVLAIAGALLAGCQAAETTAALAPIPEDVLDRIDAIGSTPMAPIYVRIFKEESQFEIWKRRTDGTYALLDTYAICAWSGELGPKLVQGDRQAPEGFYTVTPAQLNPDSSYHLSFDLGYPNTFDRSLGRTGANLMVHGACSSAGCYSMTDETVEVIYALVREAFRGGQRAFEVHAFPFRMTAENMARHSENQNFAFWQMLKDGYDHFEVTHTVPEVDVCDHRYLFDADADGARFNPTAACPAYEIPQRIAAPLAAKQAIDAERYRNELARLDAAGVLVASAAPNLTPLPMPVAAYAAAEVDPMPVAATSGAPVAATTAPEPQPLPEPAGGAAFRRFFGR